MSRLTALEEHHKTYNTKRFDFPIGPVTYLNNYVVQNKPFDRSEQTLTRKNHAGAVFFNLPNVLEVVCLDLID